MPLFAGFWGESKNNKASIYQTNRQTGCCFHCHATPEGLELFFAPKKQQSFLLLLSVFTLVQQPLCLTPFWSMDRVSPLQKLCFYTNPKGLEILLSLSKGRDSVLPILNLGPTSKIDQKRVSLIERKHVFHHLDQLGQAEHSKVERGWLEKSKPDNL